MKLQYTVDDGKTWIPCDGIQVSRFPVNVPGEEYPGDLVFNFTDEGLITDVWMDREDESGACVNPGTSAEMYDDIVSRLCEDNQ